MKRIERDFDSFVLNLELTYRFFRLERYLTTSQLKRPLKENRKFFDLVRSALFRCYVIGLANMLEKPNSRFSDVLSVFFLMDVKLENHEQTIKKIFEWRNKFVAHWDVNQFRNVDTSRLSEKEIESLFEKVAEIVDDLKTRYNRSENYKNRLQKIKQEIDSMLFDFKLSVGELSI